jgi:hypothetical protein
MPQEKHLQKRRLHINIPPTKAINNQRRLELKWWKNYEPPPRPKVAETFLREKDFQLLKSRNRAMRSTCCFVELKDG